MAAFKKLIDPSELQKYLEDANWRIVDCRFDLMSPAAGREAYLRGHIPGAVYADLNMDFAGPVRGDTGRHPLPDVEDLAATCARLGIDRDTQVVVYDDCSGAMAARGWWLLRWLGHERVALLDGGFRRWQALGQEVQSGAVSVPEKHFVALPQNERVIATDELEAAFASAAPVLVDARDAARFRGDREAMDPIAGHIPGARNLPFSDSLNDDGTWKAPTDLRGLWAAVLGEAPDHPWYVMCGSGVTACHLALSAVVAGYEEPRLYVGSWSEWIRDPHRAISTSAG